eukprot:jgi/Bigna1/84168/fgenesh1_pg.125_\
MSIGLLFVVEMHGSLDDWSGKVAVACPELQTLQTLWVFGYGSLMWKQGFSFVEKRVCCLKGYKRRFWQASTDHRGTPKFPGRVVTLVPDEKCSTWGCAFRIHKNDRQEVIKYLDKREKGGYSQRIVAAYNKQGKEVAKVLVYIGTNDNKAYVHEPKDENTAQIIAKAVGPSGRNVDYLRKLAHALKENDVIDDDPHVKSLMDLVADYEKSNHREEKVP